MVENPPPTATAPPQASDHTPVGGGVDETWAREAFAGLHPIIRRLGVGASGAVFLARDNALARMVALKVLAPALAADPAAHERFRTEARTNARLSHPNIVPIYSVGERAGTMYLTMRYIPGMPLSYHLWRGERWPVDQVCRILADVAGALDYAHREQVIHRDVKPENILLDKTTGAAMLTDFGIARGVSLNAMRRDEMRAERDLLWGTPHFMAPEQASGGLEVDGRADLYALGVIGFALLAGRLPFEGLSVMDLIGKHLHTPLPDLTELVDPSAQALIPVITTCLAKHPHQRYADGRALRTAILAAESPEVAAATTRSSWWRRFRGRGQ